MRETLLGMIERLRGCNLFLKAHTMQIDWNLEALADGLRCYRHQEFFLAHEYWESVWIKCRQPEKTFLQALIQLACALHHFQRNNLRGATSLLTAALRKLQNYPAQYGGIEVAMLREEMGDWLLALSAEEQHACPSFPQIRTLPPEPPADLGETIALQ